MTHEFVISVVDDNPHGRHALRVVLNSAGFEVRAFSSAEQFLADDVPGRGCLMVDILVPGRAELQAEIARRGIDLPVIVITDHANVALAVAAMKAGAVDFLEEPITREALLASIGRAIEHGCRVGDQAAEIIAARRTILGLVYRERRVLHLLAAGHSTATAAAMLGMSCQTVETHRARIMKKINAQNLSDLVRLSLLAARSCCGESPEDST